MPRITPVFGATDYPGDPDDATRADLAELFATLFPGVADPAFDAGHIGMALAAHSPRLALMMSQLSRFLALDAGWSRRTDLRELAIQAVNLHFGSAYSFETRRKPAEAAGIGADVLAALPDWRTTALLDDEQRLVVEFAFAVAAGPVPADLTARMVAAFGERGTVEATAVIGMWSFWAMLLNAAQPD